MADAIALDSLVNTDVTPDAKPSGLGGFLSRVQKVSQNLRNLSRQDVVNYAKQTGQNIVDRVQAIKHNFANMTPEQKKTLASSIAAGLLTKLAITMTVGTGGIGAVAVIGTAMATGATVSLVQTAVTHAREGKSLKSFFNRENLKKIGTSAILAGGTAGWGDVLHNLLGETATHVASATMHTKMNNSTLAAKLFALTPGSNAHAGTLNVPQSIGTVHAPITNVDLTDYALGPNEELVPDSNLAKSTGEMFTLTIDPDAHAVHGAAPAPTATVATPAVDTVPEVPAVANDVPASVETPVPDDIPAPAEAVATPVADPIPMQASTPEAPLQPDVQAPTVDQTPVEAPIPQAIPPSSPSPKFSIRGDEKLFDRAMNWVREQRGVKAAPAMAAVETPPAAPVAHVATAAPQPVAPAPVAEQFTPAHTASSKEIAEQAIAKAKQVVSQQQLTNHYTLERMQHIIKSTTGIDAPVGATAEDLAKQIHLKNPDAFLRAIQAQAPKIDVDHLATYCTVEIPQEKSAVNLIETLCYKFKETMGSQSIAIVEHKGDLKLLYKQAVGAMFGRVSIETTQDFISGKISGANGVVQEMAEAKLGL